MRLHSLPLLLSKSTYLLLTLLSTTSTDAFAFGFSPAKLTALPSLPSKITTAAIAVNTPTNIEDEAKNREVIHNNRNGVAVAGVFFAGMCVAAQAALATPPLNTLDTITTTPTTAMTTTLLSDSSDIFELPSYSEAKKNKSIEVDVESANRATMEKSRKARFDTNIDVESKSRSDKVRKDEIQEEDRMEKMMRLADEERKE